jgi:hypothetical protein
MQRSTKNPLLAVAGLVGILIFPACILVLHVVQSELSPLDVAMSYYVHGRYGWLLSLSLVSLGIGSAGISIAATHRLPDGLARRVAMAGLGLWSIGAIVGGLFPADPPGNWDQPPSVTGAVHGIAAVIALTAFPVGASAFALCAKHDDRWKTSLHVLLLFTLLVDLSYIAFAASLTPALVRPGPPILLGLTERIQLASYVAWLAFVATRTYRMDASLRAELHAGR